MIYSVYEDQVFTVIEVDSETYDLLDKYDISKNDSYKVFLGNALERDYLSSILNITLEGTDYYKVKIHHN